MESNESKRFRPYKFYSMYSFCEERKHQNTRAQFCLARTLMRDERVTNPLRESGGKASIEYVSRGIRCTCPLDPSEINDSM